MKYNPYGNDEEFKKYIRHSRISATLVIIAAVIWLGVILVVFS